MGYDFCRFFRAEYDKVSGIILLINATLEGVFDGDFTDFQADELMFFIQNHIPFRVQLTENATTALIEYMNENNLTDKDYRILKRTCFELKDESFVTDFKEEDVEFNPILDDVYNILSEGFPNLLDYPLWLTDTSHRCRHGISRVLTYKKATCATIMFDIDNNVLIGEVATSKSSRGCGYARDFLKWLAGFLKGLNKRAVLYALDVRVSFYREIGFKELEHEYVFERIESEKDELSKGELV
jgi:GNAT superfamily N-acetyltransferase